MARPDGPEEEPSAARAASAWLRTHRLAILAAAAVGVAGVAETLDALVHALAESDALETTAIQPVSRRTAASSARPVEDILVAHRALDRAIRRVARRDGLAIETEDAICAAVQASVAATASAAARTAREHAVRAQEQLDARDAALGNAAHQLRAVADSVPIHLLHVDRDERLLFANRAAAETWKVPAEALVGRTIREVVGADTHESIREHTARVLRGERVSYESTFDAPAGTRTFLNTYSPDRDDDGTVRGFVATGTDITERKRTEEALRETVDRLHQERERRERFVAMLSHDLRTPLHAAMMSSQLLGRNADDPGRVRDLALRLTRNIQRADHMLRDLLDASRIEAGERVTVDAEPCDLVAVASHTLDELASIHGSRFVLRGPPALEGFWSCSGVRRILENLCSNAVKYGAPGAPVAVALARDAHDQVTIAVHNHGEPIPEAEHAALFDVFRRSTSATTSGQPGWGLGLALVKGLAEAHGGRVEVESSSADGTLFTVVLPRDARA